MTERVSRMDVRDLAMVRRAILGVIDDGGSDGMWHLYESSHSDYDEAGINEQRLRFCDAVQAAIMKEIGPDEAQLKAAMASTK